MDPTTMTDEELHSAIAGEKPYSPQWWALVDELRFREELPDPTDWDTQAD